MPEYYTPELELSIKIFCRITLASAYEGTALHIMHHAYVVSKRRKLLSTDREEKLIYLHGNLRNTSSCNRLTGASVNL